MAEDWAAITRGSLLRRWLVSLAAAFGLWAFIVNHEIIQWVDDDAKRFAIVALALVLGAAASVPLFGRFRGPWTRIAVVIIGCLALGELRRAWLRYQYAVERAGGAPIELFHPITTTDLELRHFDLALRGLGIPRLRIVQLTDLHITEALPQAYYERVARELGERKPDIVVFTGDYLSRIRRLPLLEQFLRIVPRGRYGSFGVLGNHDHWDDPDGRSARMFAAAGITLLPGTCTVVPIAGTPGLRLCGTDSPWGAPLTGEAIASGAPGTTPLVVMTHTPDNIYSLRELGAAVVFAGHTHGGQMRLPLLGSIIVPSIYGRRFDLGHFTVEGSALFVSAGVGADAPPLRIYCHPELLEVDLSDAE